MSVESVNARDVDPVEILGSAIERRAHPTRITDETDDTDDIVHIDMPLAPETVWGTINDADSQERP